MNTFQMRESKRSFVKYLQKWTVSRWRDVINGRGRGCWCSESLANFNPAYFNFIRRAEPHRSRGTVRHIASI